MPDDVQVQLNRQSQLMGKLITTIGCQMVMVSLVAAQLGEICAQLGIEGNSAMGTACGEAMGTLIQHLVDIGDLVLAEEGLPEEARCEVRNLIDSLRGGPK